MNYVKYSSLNKLVKLMPSVCDLHLKRDESFGSTFQIYYEQAKENRFQTKNMFGLILLDGQIPIAISVCKLYDISVDYMCYVKPEHRKSGIGKELYEASIIVFQKKFDKRAISVFPWNTASVKFYEKLGAKPVSSYGDWQITLAS